MLAHRNPAATWVSRSTSCTFCRCRKDMAHSVPHRRCGRDECLTRVKRVARYDSFEALLDAEGPEKVNPASPRDQQLASIRRIYGPEKEALGVLAIEIERVGADRGRGVT
jgi:hypothetical protein